ncbi:ABC transporter [Sulfuriferula sp. AH1]|uniref:ABC transporter ATP-binding protein n=1 Tax=Sulfuriferula sp. AH1 TaxID=1985873 RepID=UPI000B3B7295|nr:ATP-binding cassette domain-containing protein [Sulfuriferula sp. AH1]ARU32139.1 ABC transporter [Sulfuriferula sp. AH1]
MTTPAQNPILHVVDLAKQVTLNGAALTILHPTSFDILRGESVAIVGASGSGKSTLLGLLAGLDLPSQGEVWLAGQSLAAMDEDGRARLRGELIGFVFQSFQLLPMLTAVENVMLPLELNAVADARKRAQYWLERVGLVDRQQHRAQQLSGGEQQRVAIARAFAVNPALLLADEPTGNLDSETGARVIELLFELNREQGTTLVLVTHDDQLAASCGRRLALRAGHLESRT